MKIIIDTNIFQRDFSLESSSFKVFFSDVNPAGHLLYIPRIVFEELINNFYEETKKLFKSARKIGISYMAVTVGTSVESPEDAKNNYRALVNRKLHAVGATIIDYPQVSHSRLITKALERKKPFKQTDTGGYRDALLWETVLEIACQEPRLPVAFITSNTKDFFDEKTNDSLHPDLLEEIALLEGKCGAIQIYNGLDSFIETEIQPTLESLEDIRAQLAAGDYPHLDLHDFILRNLPNRVGWMELDSTELGFPSAFETPTLSNVEDLHSITDLAVWRLPTGELLISFCVDADCIFDYFIEKSTYYAEYEDELEIMDSDWNNYYMWGSREARAVLKINMTFNPANNEVTSARIIEATSSEE